MSSRERTGIAPRDEAHVTLVEIGTAAHAMSMTQEIRFNNGAGYERYMGRWSVLVGEQFLEWLVPDPGGRWLDVGCGNGAFTELIVDRGAPASVIGIDPSEDQLAFARSRLITQSVDFRHGDAMALDFAADDFDIAVMSLVIFFVPKPATGVAEMVRVVRPGGTVAAYAWHMEGGGFPYYALQREMRSMGLAVPTPPNPDASRLEVLQSLWTDAGLEEVETREIMVQRTFANFDDYWETILLGPSVGPTLAAMTADEMTHLRERMRADLPTDAVGRITYSAMANAVRGRVPMGA